MRAALLAIAPDMRGYGRSSVYQRHEDYALEQTVIDMIESLNALGRERAVWVWHDWSSPVAWSLASHYPELHWCRQSLRVLHCAGTKRRAVPRG
jgi:pimeloyl-ACP methyl ester carboxylesterase